MGAATFAYELDARATLARAVALLGDLSRLAEVHPTISRVDRIDPVDGAAESYRMIDSTRWGPFAFALDYRADLLSRDSEDGWARITTRARQSGMLFWNETLLVQRAETVHGRVSVTLQTPPLIGGWVLDAMRARHEAVLPRTVDALERGSGR